MPTKDWNTRKFPERFLATGDVLRNFFRVEFLPMGLREGTLERLPVEAQDYITELERETKTLREQHAVVTEHVQTLQSENSILNERLNLLLYRRFARSAESVPDGQGELFAEAESEVPEAAYVEVPAHKRSKRGRKAIDEKHPRVDVVHDIPDEEKQCACGHELEKIGEETSERIQVVPEQIWVERHIRPKYACKNCEGSGDEEKPAVRVAPAEPSMIPGSITTPGLLAFILVNKFVDHLPFYRQEKRFERIGFHIPRQDMSNWTMAVGKRIQPLIQKFRDRIRAGPVVQMDETPVQVLKEPGRENTKKSYMWLARGGAPEAPVCLYHYTPTRSAEYPRTLLGDYSGYLQVDGYSAYQTLAAENTDLTLVGCWAHARRKFFEAGKGSKKAGATHEAVAKIRKLYTVEAELREKNLSDQEFLAIRREEVQPLFEDLKGWLSKKAQEVVPGTLLGKAVAYIMKQWDSLVRYLDHAWLTPDNNAAENAIRPFVLGRKNWLFNGSPCGADASCAIYSIIETSKQNRLNPYAYLHYILTRVPEITNEAEWEEILPQNVDPDEVNNAPFAPVR